MITLLLLHPLKRNPVQSWSFENESVVRIGRSTDNHVILYSAVVSRHHVELRQTDATWEIVNLGTNGTYLDGKRITKVPVVDGAIIRLARSGPNIQIRLGTEALKSLPEHLTSEALSGQRIDHHPTVTDINDASQLGSEPSTNMDQGEDANEPPTGIIPVPPHLRIPDEDSTPSASMGQQHPQSLMMRYGAPPVVSVARAENASVTSSTEVGRSPGKVVTSLESPHLSNRPLKTIGDYKIFQVLGKGDVSVTYLAERDGQTLVLKALNADWLTHPKAQAALEMEAELLDQLESPHIPRLLDFFVLRDRPYLVMERIDGSLLSHHIKQEGVCSVPQAISKLLKICDILSYLHQFVPPVLHRNIEASNIICRHASDDLVLISFGAVKSLVLERNGYVGSHGCTDPDQLSISATPQVDLYGLAPMLAYLLTGKNPVTFCKRQGNNHYQFMADAVTGLSGRIITIMQRLTHADAQYHYPSVEAVSDALRSLVSAA